MDDLFSRLYYIRAKIRELEEEKKLHRRDQQTVEDLFAELNNLQNQLHDSLMKNRSYADKLKSLLESKNMRMTIYDEMMEEINSSNFFVIDQAIDYSCAKSRYRAIGIWEKIESLSLQIRNLENSEYECLAEIAAAKEGGTEA